MRFNGMLLMTFVAVPIFLQSWPSKKDCWVASSLLSFFWSLLTPQWDCPCSSTLPSLGSRLHLLVFHLPLYRFSILSNLFYGTPLPSTGRGLLTGPAGWASPDPWSLSRPPSKGFSEIHLICGLYMSRPQSRGCSDIHPVCGHWVVLRAGAVWRLTDPWSKSC